MKKIQQHENQITRLCLTGSGIVCGLDIYVDEDYGVLIRSGNGLTSNGQYIEVQQSTWYRYCRPYANDTYPLFQGVDLWELTEDYYSDGEPLKPQSSNEELNPFLRDKVVLLFIEEDVQTGDSVVLPLMMDQQQLLEKLNLRQLSTQLLWEQLGDDDDFIYSDDYNPDDTRPSIHNLNLAVNPALRLPELYLRRFGFSKGDPFDCPPEGVDTSEFPCFEAPTVGEFPNYLDDLYEAYVPIIDEATFALDAALTQLHTDFGALMDWNKNQRVEEWIGLLCEKWEAYKTENEDEPIGTKYYIQYFYDWARDLVQAYNELRQELIDLVIACCANVDEYPNHLFLGIALRDGLSRQPKPLRHTFVQPPIYNGNADRLQRTRLYCWRVLMMIKGFYLPDYISDEEINPYCGSSNMDEDDMPDFSQIKITPGRFYDDPLGEQTIPYYYPVTWSRYSVHHFWNYERTKSSSTDHLLSYHASDLEDSYTQVYAAIRPLHYSLNKYPFFRVEGHIGKPLQDVYIREAGEITIRPGAWSTLKYLKTKYNLPVYFRHVPIDALISAEKYRFPNIPDQSQTDCPDFPTLINEMRGSGKLEEFCSLDCDYLDSSLLGAEHQAGVKEGGTFILLTQQQDVEWYDEKVAIVIADLTLPCCYNDCSDEIDVICKTIEGEIIEPPRERPVVEKVDELSSGRKETEKTDDQKERERPGPAERLLVMLGKAEEGKKDNLKAIKGIGPAFERDLNKMGIFTYEQVSKMTDESYSLLDDLISQNNRGRARRDQWAEKAKELHKNKSK